MTEALPSVIIGGPTASGKTAIALAVAEACGGEIIGADAFQLYQGLPILTAQPTPEELQEIPHHLIGEFNLQETLDVTRYLDVARAKIRQVREAGRIPILVGGTGLYIRSILFGLADGLPSPNASLRAELEAQPLPSLQAQLQALDPVACTQVDLLNPRRVIRALEVCIQTGRPFSSFKHNTSWNQPPIGIWLTRDRSELHQRIELRTKQMIELGAIDEVREALPKIGPTAGQVIGLRPIEAYLEGRSSLGQTLEAIALSTRQYAKRQETWFRKETALRPVPPEQALDLALSIIQSQLPPP